VADYRHVQFGWAIAVGTGLGALLALAVTLTLSAEMLRDTWWLVAALFAVLGAAWALFASLAVEVDAREVRVRFGIGLIRKTIAIADILRADVVRTRIWWGWGLHWTPAGWLYNVAGRDAVRLELRRERALMIGSDEAGRLKEAIDTRIAEHAGRLPVAPR
jgi:hypothetical protein